jgi:choline dehydrogenase-like flavoprotein
LTIKDAAHDVVLVGSGIMAGIVARQVREAYPFARIAMIDAGPPIGSKVGHHLHDSPEPAIWQEYNRRVAADNQALYVGPEFKSAIAGDIRDARPGMYAMSALGQDAAEMPGAALSWNLGGMSVHWTATTPIPWGGETFSFGDDRTWQQDLSVARRLLEVVENPFGVAPSGRMILNLLERRFGAVCAAGRHPQTMPMAVASGGAPPWPRIGPNRIFPALQGGDDRFTLIADTLVTGLVHDGAKVTAARVKRLATGEEHLISGTVFAVCADAMRSPQLLHASSIKLPALGRYLNEHAFVGSTIRPDPAGLIERDLPSIGAGEWRAGSYWLPHSDVAQPFHGQVVETYRNQNRKAEDYTVGLTWYVPTEIRPENRLEFSDELCDVFGMPRISVRFGYTERDRAMIEAAAAALVGVAQELGGTDSWDILPPGSSLHFTGTVRMGPVDDNTSVCDPGAKVWGFDNLYVAGNGVIPTAMLGNTTLTGAITAVRAGRSIAESLA